MSHQMLIDWTTWYVWDGSNCFLILCLYLSWQFILQGQYYLPKLLCVFSFFSQALFVETCCIIVNGLLIGNCMDGKNRGILGIVYIGRALWCLLERMTFPLRWQDLQIHWEELNSDMSLDSTSRADGDVITKVKDLFSQPKIMVQAENSLPEPQHRMNGLVMGNFCSRIQEPWCLLVQLSFFAHRLRCYSLPRPTFIMVDIGRGSASIESLRLIVSSGRMLFDPVSRSVQRGFDDLPSETALSLAILMTFSYGGSLWSAKIHTQDHAEVPLQYRLSRKYRLQSIS